MLLSALCRPNHTVHGKHARVNSMIVDLFRMNSIYHNNIPKINDIFTEFFPRPKVQIVKTRNERHLIFNLLNISFTCGEKMLLREKSFRGLDVGY